MASVKRIVSKQLGQLLLERGIIDQAQLDKSLNVQREEGGMIGQILVNMGFVTEEQIAQALTIQYGFPYLPLENYELNKEAINMIPKNVAQQYGLIAIDKIGNMLTVAMSNPLNVQAIDDIEMITKCRVQIFVSTMTGIQKAIEKYYSGPDSESKKE